MNNYEIMIVVKPMPEENLNAIIDKTKSIITADGKVDKVDNWGEKRLAYEISGLNTGIYLLFTYIGTCDVTREIDRYMKINEDILRHMIVRKDY